MDAMERFRRELRDAFENLWPGEEKPLVLGEGPANAPALMLVGEAPGEQETLQGRPFVGRAGKNLEGFLQAVGLAREQIYITNVVKVRPIRVSAAGRVSNRPPNREEKLLFTPWLLREIALVRPGLVATLGNVALQALLGAGCAIGACHGRLLSCPAIPTAEGGLPLFPLYHPASVIYNPALLAAYQGDLAQLRSLLAARGVVN